MDPGSADSQAADDLGRLEALHSKLLDRAEELLQDGDHSLALQMIKHNGVTAPKRADKGTMEDATRIASKLTFTPRQQVTPLTRKAG